jgi:hypothetical protein
MQVGAVHHEVGRAVARDRLGAEVEQLPGLAGVPQPDLLAGRLAPDLAQFFLKPETEQHPRAVRRDLHAGAELGEVRRLLVDLDVVAVAQQRQRGREPTNAGADDQDAQCCVSGSAACDPARIRHLLDAPQSAFAKASAD